MKNESKDRSIIRSLISKTEELRDISQAFLVLCQLYPPSQRTTGQMMASLVRGEEINDGHRSLSFDPVQAGKVIQHLRVCGRGQKNIHQFINDALKDTGVEDAQRLLLLAYSYVADELPKLKALASASGIDPAFWNVSQKDLLTGDIDHLQPLLERCRLMEDGTSAPPASTPSEGTYMFRQVGNNWRIVFGGEPMILSHTKGLSMIAYLLANPNKDVLAVELCNLGRTGPVSDKGRMHSHHTEKELAEQGQHISRLGESEEVIDQEALRQYKEEENRLQGELTKANKNNDEAAIARLEKDIRMIQEETLKATGLGQKMRNARNPVETARANVRQQVKAAIENISKFNLSLGQYLETTIRTGKFCSYRGDPTHLIPWEL